MNLGPPSIGSHPNQVHEVNPIGWALRKSLHFKTTAPDEHSPGPISFKLLSFVASAIKLKM